MQSPNMESHCNNRFRCQDFIADNYSIQISNTIYKFYEWAKSTEIRIGDRMALKTIRACFFDLSIKNLKTN